MSAFKVPKNETLATPNSGQTLEKPFDYWEKKSGSPLPSTLEKKLKTLEKRMRICTLNLSAAEISYLYTIAGFGHLNMHFA